MELGIYNKRILFQPYEAEYYTGFGRPNTFDGCSLINRRLPLNKRQISA